VYTTRNSLYGTLGLDRVLSGPEARTPDLIPGLDPWESK
jgi:hypothetical protein